MKRAIRHLIIGKDTYIESANEFKQVMLSGHYALIGLVVLVIYSVLDLLQGTKDTTIVFSIAFLLIASTLVLHRYGQHCLANYILFPSFNLVVFLIGTSEDLVTGTSIFFLPIALGASAVFNYQQRKIAYAFNAFSFILFSLTLLQGFSILPFRNYTPADIHFIQLLNLATVFPVSFMAIHLLNRLSHYHAGKLIQSNKQLEKLNQELDRFVYSTSHDLRAPLLSILGLLKLAETSTESETTKYHRLMHERAQNLDKFIKDITDYSRNNRLQVVHEPVKPAQLANDIWEALRYSEDAIGIEFINDISEDLIVMNDSTRLRVVLSNLISNAIRYHDQRKENKYIRVSHQLTSSSFSLHIQDNGQGIAPEFQTKIFDMFFRGNESSQGSGLGLYIVKETLAKLSASIALCSTPRQGSTFSITLPV